MKLAGAASHSSLLAAVSAADGVSATSTPSETRVRGIDLAGDAGAWDSTLPSAETHWASTYSYGELAADRQEVTNLRLPGQYDERLLGSLGLQGPYYNGARWYLPGVGRYLELDPIALRGGFNGIGWFAPDWYNYAGGNPLTNVDPLGLQAAPCLPGDSTVVCCMKKFPGCPECCGATGPEPPRTPVIPWPPPWWPWKDPQPPPNDCSPKQKRDCDAQYAADVAKCGTLPMYNRPPCYESAMTRKNLCEQGMPVPPLFTG